MATQLGDFVAGEILGADDLNDIGTWSSFTVTTTGSAAMTFTGAKCVLNELCIFQIIGTATGAATPPTTVTVPETMKASNYAVGLQVACYDDSANVWYYGSCTPSTVNIIRPRVFAATGTYVNSTGVNSSVPFTWANDDIIVISGSYRMS